ncbi:MAG: DEAD/DEAH box helicase [Planctomycetota bacterium]|nr:DEAD/DEAH box helicase [Planctomycetota bacterium]
MSQESSTPITSFAQFNLTAPLAKAIEMAQYSTPRPIQATAIPPALEGRDVLGLAMTGTGKTAAFAIPCIEHLLLRNKPGPRVLVVGPTRELVTQIEEEFRKLARGTRIRTMTIYGGVSEKPQIKKLDRRPDVICACPGRLLDLLGQGYVDLSRVDTLILDEADHMFDMGFLPDIKRILEHLQKRRQNLLFAATMPREIRGLAEQMLVDPFVVEIDHSAPASTIEHALYPVRESRKTEMLKELLQQDGFESAIVFTRTKRRARQLAEKLESEGHRAVALQGNMSQGQRDRAMKGFRQNTFDILVATDIAARGIDVERVSHVINLDIPNTPEAYTHRIGRTGRSEREGKAFTFITESDGQMIRAIERSIGSSIEIKTIPGFEEALIPSRTGRKNSSESRNRSAHSSSRSTSGAGQGRKPRRRRPSDSSGSNSPRHRSATGETSRSGGKRSTHERSTQDRSGQPRSTQQRSGQDRKTGASTGEAKSRGSSSQNSGSQQRAHSTARRKGNNNSQNR